MTEPVRILGESIYCQCRGPLDWPHKSVVLGVVGQISRPRRQLTLSCNTSKICQNNGKTAHFIVLKLLTTATYDARPVTLQKTLSVCSWVVFSLEVPWWPRLVLFVIQAPYRLHGLTRVLTKGQMLLAIHVVTTNSTHQNCTYVLHVSHV